MAAGNYQNNLSRFEGATFFTQFGTTYKVANGKLHILPSDLELAYKFERENLPIDNVCAARVGKTKAFLESLAADVKAKKITSKKEIRLRFSDYIDGGLNNPDDIERHLTGEVLGSDDELKLVAVLKPEGALRYGKRKYTFVSDQAIERIEKA